MIGDGAGDAVLADQALGPRLGAEEPGDVGAVTRRALRRGWPSLLVSFPSLFVVD